MNNSFLLHVILRIFDEIHSSIEIVGLSHYFLSDLYVFIFEVIFYSHFVLENTCVIQHMSKLWDIDSKSQERQRADFIIAIRKSELSR